MSNKYLLRPDGYVLGEAPGSRIIISGSSDQVVTEFIGVSEPLLRLSNGDTTVDLLGPGSGWKLDDPYWNPQIAQYKGGGVRVNSGVAEGQRLVHKEYDNVIETIPLIASSVSMNATTRTIREVLQLIRQAADYWTESYELDDVWMEWRSAAPGCGIGYARIVQAHIPELKNPYGQPFYSCLNDAMMEGLNLIVEREPLWRGVPPGQIVGPLYNLIRNPDFSLWNFGIADSQPDNWSDLETIQITGTNNRQDTANRALDKYSLRVRVSGSTLTGRIKGVTQVIQDIKANTEYTILAWVRSEGVSNGVGRILVTYSSQIELYRDDTRHGWNLYGTKFTTGTNDTVGISCEILTTAANTDGTVYFADLMLIEGDFIEEATNGTLPWIGGSHIVNHWDQPENGTVEAGDINYVDVWDVPGDEDSLIRLEIVNNTTPADASNPVELYSVIRVGQRRTGDVFNFDNYFDPAGITDTTASSNTRLESIVLGTSFTDVTAKIISGADKVRNTLGRFRVLARLYSDRIAGGPALKTQLQYWIGASEAGVKQLQSVLATVRQQWFISNLTPNTSVNFDAKFTPDLPGQLGYRIQMNMPAGNIAQAFVDYIMLMPTDGGYLEATLDIPLTQNNALIVDNTASQAISATVRRQGSWIQDYLFTSFSSSILRTMVVFNGDLYIAGRRSNGVSIDGVVLRRRDGVWTVFDMPQLGGTLDTRDIYDLAVYNGVLYAAGGGPGAGDGVVFSSPDGATWSVARQPSKPVKDIFILEVFDGKLWTGSGEDQLLGAPKPAYLESYDGTSWVLENTYSKAGFSAQYQGSVVYNNKLYLGLNTRDIRSYSAATGYTVEHTDASRTYTNSFVVFNGAVYALTSSDILKYDGSSFSIITASTSSTDDLTTEVISGPGITATTLNVLGSGEHILTSGGFVQYVGARWLVLSGTQVIYNAQENAAYKVGNYQGNPFTCPPKKRHRYFFSYDRENFINNVDDAALIGIGFVPRYLSLRGKG